MSSNDEAESQRFCAVVHVRFLPPLVLDEVGGTGEQEVIGGFYQTFGCTAAGRNALRNMLEAHIEGYDFLQGAETTIRMEFDRVDAIPHELFAQWFEASGISEARMLANPKGLGIWYKSGRALYPAEDRGVSG